MTTPITTTLVWRDALKDPPEGRTTTNVVIYTKVGSLLTGCYWQYGRLYRADGPNPPWRISPEPGDLYAVLEPPTKECGA